MTIRSNSHIPSVLCALILINLIVLSGFLVPRAQAQHRAPVDSSTVVLTKPNSESERNFAGDEQYQVAGEQLAKPLRVRVMRGGTPVPNWPVYFSVISTPFQANGTTLTPEIAYSDAEGYAESYVVLGSKDGLYTVSAEIDNGPGGGDVLIFEATGRDEDWVFALLMGLFGGLGLFLFGMEMMSDGMKKTAGSQMRAVLGTLTENRFIAVGVGAFVTMVIQSSSATTVMLVSFVQAGLMQFSQTLGILLGASIGTTITAQLIAFKLTDYALLMVAIGFVLTFMAKKEKIKNIGETLLGFGLLFYGMHVMSSAMSPLRTYDPFIGILLSMENPLLGIVVGTLFTALIQSSSAFIGIIIVLATQGLLTLEAGIPLLFGANIGTCVTALLASIKARRAAKRVAIAHTMFKVLSVLLFFWWIPYFAELVRWVSPGGTAGQNEMALMAEVVPRQIANAHTIFNVALTLVVLPFLDYFAVIINKMLPDIVEKDVDSPYQARYLDKSLISTPDLALSLAKVETLRMGRLVEKMVAIIIRPFLEDDDTVLTDIDNMEKEVDYLETEITDYLAHITQKSVSQARMDEAFQMMHTVTELELIADIVSDTLKDLALKRLEQGCSFSEAGQEEIRDYHSRTQKQLHRALEVFREMNLEKALKVEQKYQKYRLMEMNLRRSHFDRLRQEIPATVASNEIHLELMDLLKRISSHATGIARLLIEWENDMSDQRPGTEYEEYGPI